MKRIGASAIVLAISMGAAAHAQAVISNGTVMLGVDTRGQLNIYPDTDMPSAYGVSPVGLRFVPENLESTSPGCLCEGWGVGIADTMKSGSANNAYGAANLTEVSFTSTATTATSVVEMGSSLRVTHSFAPSAETNNLYKVDVTIENISGADIADLRYTRTFDWDIEPDTFNEVVTIKGTGTTSLLLASSNNGFEDSNPFASRSGLGVVNSDVTDFGPTDQGTNFDFGFGALADGESYKFSIFYGAAATEVGALTALSKVNVELFSFGQPASDPRGRGVTDGSTGLEPGTKTATFIFGFAGVGGSVVVPPSEVPLPAAAWLLLGGLGALGSVRAFRRA